MRAPPSLPHNNLCHCEQSDGRTAADADGVTAAASPARVRPRPPARANTQCQRGAWIFHSVTCCVASMGVDGKTDERTRPARTTTMETSMFHKRFAEHGCAQINFFPARRARSLETTRESEPFRAFADKWSLSNQIPSRREYCKQNNGGRRDFVGGREAEIIAREAKPHINIQRKEVPDAARRGGALHELSLSLSSPTSDLRRLNCKIRE